MAGVGFIFSWQAWDSWDCRLITAVYSLQLVIIIDYWSALVLFSCLLDSGKKRGEKGGGGSGRVNEMFWSWCFFCDCPSDVAYFPLLCGMISYWAVVLEGNGSNSLLPNYSDKKVIIKLKQIFLGGRNAPWSIVFFTAGGLLYSEISPLVLNIAVRLGTGSSEFYYRRFEKQIALRM